MVFMRDAGQELQLQGARGKAVTPKGVDVEEVLKMQVRCR
jgi:hypothetical protein